MLKKSSPRKPTQNKKKLSCGNLETTQLPPKVSLLTRTKVLPRPPFRSWVCHVAAILCHDAPRPTKQKRNDLKETNESMDQLFVSQKSNCWVVLSFNLLCELWETKEPMALHWSLWTTIRWWAHHWNLGRVGDQALRLAQTTRILRPHEILQELHQKSWITMVRNSKVAFV